MVDTTHTGHSQHRTIHVEICTYIVDSTYTGRSWEASSRVVCVRRWPGVSRGLSRWSRAKNKAWRRQDIRAFRPGPFCKTRPSPRGSKGCTEGFCREPFAVVLPTVLEWLCISLRKVSERIECGGHDARRNAPGQGGWRMYELGRDCVQVGSG